MKIKTLEIHNIASIEDAIIDFNGKVLAGQDLFLICGPTGAGKSTILDAICLALFNNTPRMENAKKEHIDALSDDKAKQKENVKDVMHLVRKNAPDAHVRLTFEGANGEECTALWSVSRKIKKSKNNVDAKRYEEESLEDKLKRATTREWTLTDGEGKVFEKNDEVKERIQDLIKMNFDQFCKTTMLAQGDFTQFLSSSSDEKAKILEKLVGTKKYAEVGKEINRSCLEKKNEVAVLEKELSNIVFLTDDDIKERQERIAALNAETAAISEKEKTIKAKLDWIENSKKAIAATEAATEALAKAEEALNADEVKADMTTITLWMDTISVRDAMKTEAQCKSETSEQQDEKKRLEAKCREAMGGLNGLKKKVAGLRKEIESANEFLDGQQKFEKMYENASLICQAHDDVVGNQRFVAENEPKLAVMETEIKALEAKLGEHKKAQSEANAEIAAANERMKVLRGELDKYGADTIDDEVSKLNGHKLLVNQAETALSAWTEARESCKRKGDALKKSQEELAELEAKQKSASAEVEVAEKALAISKELYEKSKASIEDHAKVLRAELKAGDKCPVCGKRVDEVLSDDSFIEMLKPLEETYRNDEKRYDACHKLMSEAKADTTACRRTTAKAKDDAEKAETEMKKRLEALTEKCKALGMECDDNASGLLAGMKVADTETEKIIAERQSHIKEIRKLMEEVNNLSEDIREKKLKSATHAIEEVNDKIAKQKADKQNLNGKIELARKTSKTKQADMEGMINAEWKPTVVENYFAELKAAADDFSKAKKELANKLGSAEQCDKDIAFANACKENTIKEFADWTCHEDAVPSDAMTDLTTKWSSLQSKAQLLAAKIKATSERKAKAETTIADFFGSRSEVERDAVAAIMHFSQTDIERKQALITKLKEDNLTAQAQLQAAQKRLAELPANPLEENDSVESLNDQNRAAEGRKNECNQEIGRINNEMETDRKKREEQGEKKELLNSLRNEYADWSTLDKYLGSTDGKNFRNVAQSFILGDLLDKANEYLRNITNRYELFCNPGTLTIMMRDDFQGGVVRPTNTLSGGESFIISLSLALGLSSMQSTGFEVDTLFIDEGFGTLSPEFLDPVITSLKRLYELYGRRVGIISHVDTLKARIPVTIEVTREGNSHSKVEVIEN